MEHLVFITDSIHKYSRSNLLLRGWPAITVKRFSECECGNEGEWCKHGARGRVGQGGGGGEVRGWVHSGLDSTYSTLAELLKNTAASGTPRRTPDTRDSF